VVLEVHKARYAMSRMIRFHKFGAADVLRCEEQAEPSPAADEVQIRVQAIGVSCMTCSGVKTWPPPRPACRRGSVMKWPGW